MHLDRLEWRTGGFGGVSGNCCADFAAAPIGVAVRDTEDPSTPHLHAAGAWRAVLAGVRDGDFGR